MNRSRTVLLGALSTGALVAAGLVAGPAGGEPAAPPGASVAGSRAALGSPGSWTRVDAGPAYAGTSTGTPSVLRMGDGNLLTAWVEDGPSGQVLMTRIVSGANGAPLLPAQAVISPWSSLTGDPVLTLDPSGQYAVVFSGLRTTTTTDPWTAPMAYATSPDGVSWTFQEARSLSKGGAASSYGIAATQHAGALVTAFTPSSSNHVLMHFGTDATVPATGADLALPATESVTVPQVVTDRGTGELWAFWHSLSSGAVSGLSAVRSANLAARIPVPGSQTVSGGVYDSYTPDQRTAAVSGSAGGIWVAFRTGTSPGAQLSVWSPTTNRTLGIKRGNGVRRVALAAAPEGRLWLIWSEDESRSVYAVRSNRAVTRWGEIRELKNPAPAQGGYVYKTAGDAANGYLDLFVNLGVSGQNGRAIWHQQVLPGLTIKVKPKQLKQGKVTVKVTDAGDAVKKAKVTFRGAKAKTNAKGVAKFKVAQGTKPGKYKLTATASGYFPARGTVKIRR